MNSQDRAETRLMLHDVLEGWEKNTAHRDNMLLMSLEKIDKHLEKLNGKIAEHEKTLNQELPHTIANCPQQEQIQSLRDNLISAKAIKRAIYSSVIITGTLFTIIFIVYNIFK
jgi:hypothetical protein